jgi:hypothetical protein
MSKSVAIELFEAKTTTEKRKARERLEEHVRGRVSSGMQEKQVRAAIQAWLTRLEKWNKTR